MSEAEAFEALVREIGLDPADHDLSELRAAQERLQVLLAWLELEAPAPDAEPLATFDPTALR